MFEKRRWFDKCISVALSRTPVVGRFDRPTHHVWSTPVKPGPASAQLDADASASLHAHHATPTAIWDRLGIIGSVACIIHCALTPALVGSLAALGFLADEIVHQVLVVLLLGVALLAFWPGFKVHRDLRIVVGAVAGVAILMTTGFMHAFMHDVMHDLFHSEFAETGLTMLGSGILVGTHVANQRLMRAEGACCDH
ncbi:MerC domain-containing protein [Bradymonadaceae bacterium TMQ3]|nr:MerC domain-containing protein [Bradymonadaceae bacterium TMQ3]TXC69445.1 MerC domain-containing protein [Bradymonadales bacterium TMQ1]